ncbi:MAG: peptidylprolyl isomerase [Bacteroidetes bacterium]|nr:peptidylprolyl isomerase [Bacteroidota bacterium]
MIRSRFVLATSLFVLALCGASAAAFAQPGVPESYQRLDGIIAVVGDEIVLASDIRERVLQAKLEGRTVSEDQECSLLESILFEKLLLHNARLDSLEVTDAEVMSEIDRRLAYYLQMFGTIEAFEAEYGKSVAEWKAEFNDPVREQILAQKMQGEIDQSVRSTPAQVQDYFAAIPVDSLPLIPEELSYSELVMQPEVGEAQKMRTRNTLDSIRYLVETGKMSMTLAATRYSEDPGSKYKGGCYKNIARGQFVPEFEGAVYETEVGGYSPVFESDFGFHFLRVTDRRGEQYSACHVLMKPTFDPKALDRMQSQIDSVSVKLALGDLPFEAAVLQYSTRDETRNQKGQVVNVRDGGTRFGVDELDPNVFFLLQDLDPGEVSAPVQLLDEDNQAYWALIRLDERFPAHRANPQDDYALFQQQVEAELREEALSTWIDKRIGETFIRVDAPYDVCTLDMPWLTESINASGAFGSSSGN